MAIKTAEIPVSYPYLSVQYIYIGEIFTWDYPPPPCLETSVSCVGILYILGETPSTGDTARGSVIIH